MPTNCTCSRRRRACTLLVRAFRAVCGIILIGMLTSFILRYAQKSHVNSKYDHLQREIDRLKYGKVQKRPSAVSVNTGCNKETEKDGSCGDAGREIRDIIRKELSLYYADKTGMADFALENLGACILTIRNTKTYCGENSSYFAIFSTADSEPNKILQPDITPGNCWAFAGSHGTVVIKLMSFVFISHVTLEHIPRAIIPSGDISSAPKTFTLWGLTAPDDSTGKHKFGTFKYEKHGSPVQIFPVQQPTKRSFRIVEVTFHDNHGNAKYTCVYRVRIHGKMDGGGGISGKPPS